MNALLALATTATAAATNPIAAPPAAASPIAMPARPARRERDLGVGYVNSSGYASAPRYADHRELPRFRCG